MKNHTSFIQEITDVLVDEFNVTPEIINEFDLDPVFIEYANHIAQGEDEHTAFDLVAKLAIESLKDKL